MTEPSITELAAAIADATRSAVTKLFREHPGHFYYLSLITTGEGHAPFLAAWSREALAAAVATRSDPEEARLELKWSYADSPFMSYGEEHFDCVNDLFSKRPPLSAELSREAWDTELAARLEAMEAAIAKLDSEGLFGTGRARKAIVVNVEVMPPDRTNTERARRLNPAEAISEWLEEAAE